jgi:nucleotide-binding universal stress UspA family protein
MEAKKITLRRIVVGTDFSRPASKAVRRAAILAAEHKAKLEIVHVMPLVDKTILKRMGLDNSSIAGSGSRVQELLDEAIALARSQDVSATKKLLNGGPAATLVEEAERFSADLVVVGIRGKRSIKDAIIGTTAERLIERWNRDILVVRKTPKSHYKKILIGISLAPTSCSVLMSGAALSTQALLRVVHAYELPFEMKMLSYGIQQSSIEMHRLATKRAAVRGMDELLKRCPITTERELKTILRRGNPPREILGEAAFMHANVIVVGKNRSAFEQFFIGSVTKHVVRSASSDVLVSDSRG